MRVTFLVLTCNRPKSLMNVVGSILRMKFPTGVLRRIIVWDNGDSEESVERSLARLNDERTEISYIRGSQNSFMRGKCYLEDEYLRRSSDQDKFVVHLDDDVQLSEGWLIGGMNALESNGWDACGSVETRGNRLVYSGQVVLNLESVSVADHAVTVWRWTQFLVPEDGSKFCSVEFAGHRALLVRRSVVEQVQHDPHMLIGGEDVDYSLAIREAGYSIGISHDAFIRHRASGEVDVDGFRESTRVLNSWRHFYKKWGFVRDTACREAGMDETTWLTAVSRRSANPSRDC